jgi:uncharacterized DUF497 family protein
MGPRFERDHTKSVKNQRKHGVTFFEAQLAFLDLHRVIARDIAHSGIEERFYCFGRIENAILTVRFTYRGGVIRIIGAGYWRRGRKYYEAQQKIHE